VIGAPIASDGWPGCGPTDAQARRGVSATELELFGDETLRTRDAALHRRQADSARARRGRQSFALDHVEHPGNALFRGQLLERSRKLTEQPRGARHDRRVRQAPDRLEQSSSPPAALEQAPHLPHADDVEPPAKFACIRQPAEPARGFDEYQLHDVIELVVVAEKPGHDARDEAGVAPVERCERLLVTEPCASDEGGVGISAFFRGECGLLQRRWLSSTSSQSSIP